MVVAITTFAGLFRDLGLSSAAFQKNDLTAALQSNQFWLNVPTIKNPLELRTCRQ